MLIIKSINSKKTWEQFLLNSNQASFLQSWNWGKFHQSIDNQITRIGFYRQEELVGIALLIKIKAKRGTYYECPGGPVINWRDQKQVKQVIHQIKQIAKDNQVSFIRIRPNINPSIINLKNHHFIQSPMHLHAQSTWVLDLNQSEDRLLTGMRKNTRYNIKKAKNLGVSVKTSTKVSEIDLLFKLQLETVNRKNFIPFSKKYLTKQLQAFSSDQQIQLFKASYKGKLLSISFIIFYGNEAVYHYSGSSNQFRQIPASYALQWAAIKAAKKKRMSRYNFWGYTDNPKHRFFGPSLFKKGFGGYRLDYMPAHDLPIKLNYWLTFTFETFRRKLRHL